MKEALVRWPHLIESEVDETLQRHVDAVGQTEGGRMIHNWLESTFEDEIDFLDWETDVENGRYDAADSTCVYEFKTKHPNVYDRAPPYNRDIEQVEKYLESDDVEADFGSLIYINRGDLTEVKQYLVNGSVTRID